jgi:hypothetical protein
MEVTRMPARKGMFRWVVVLSLLLLSAAPAAAARVRYHYAPANGCGTLAPQGTGERLTWTSGWEPYNCPPPRATCQVTFRHPCTGQTIVVPLGLPEGTPTIEYRPRRIVYNYGSYTVEVHFLPDGTVDVIYNSGLFRAI